MMNHTKSIMKNGLMVMAILLFSITIATTIASSTEQTWRWPGFELTKYDINFSKLNASNIWILSFQQNGTTAPPLSPLNKAYLYYNASDSKVKVSENGSGYYNAFVQSIAQVFGLQDTLNAMNGSSAVNDTASQARDDAINSTKVNKSDAGELSGGTLADARLSTNQRAISINYVFDGAGSALTANNANISMDYNATIKNIVLLGDVTGNAIINITRTSYTNFPASFNPIGNITMTAAQKTKDSTLTGWNTSLYADDVVNVNLSSVSTLTKLTVKLYVEKS